MPQINLKPELAEVVRKIRILKSHTKSTGFRTTRSVNALLARLGPDDLADVLEALQEAPSESGVRRYDPQGKLIR